MSDLQDFIDRFFSEEFRIQQIVNDALYENEKKFQKELEEQKKKFQKELEEQKKKSQKEIEEQKKKLQKDLENQEIEFRDRVIIGLSQRNFKLEEIAEAVECSIETIKEVISKYKNSKEIAN